ncbi:MAG: hypothetical protein JWS12_68 [Candidatus Saccharibacteria bacterium]|nr:hypothetical protein [Candidatus Saccharibacteria bacterium]
MQLEQVHIKSAFKFEAEHPTAGDRGIRAMAGAMYELLDEPEIQSAYDDILKFNPTLGAEDKGPYVVNKSWRAFQRNFMGVVKGNRWDTADDPSPLIYIPRHFYPERFIDDQDYAKQHISSLFRINEQGLTPLRDEFVYHVSFLEVVSNIAERAKTIKAVTQIFQPRWSEPAAILDGGCSQNQILKALRTNYRFESQQLLGGYSETNQDPDSYWVDPRMSRVMRRLMAETVEIGDSAGIDNRNIRDLGFRLWAIACSFRPEELLNIRSVNHQLDLMNAQPTGVGFLEADLREAPTKLLNKLHRQGQKYKIVLLSTVLYQLRQEDQQKVLNNMWEMVDDDGIMIVQDAIKPLSDNKDFTCTGDFNTKFMYRTLVKDKAHPDFGWQEYFVSENGRVSKLVPGLGYVAVTGSAEMGIPEALQRVGNRLL